MPGSMTLNPLVLVKFVLWLMVVAVATVLLRKRAVTPRLRLAVVVAGVLVFGFAFGALIRGDQNPNPVASWRALLTSVLVRHRVVLPIVAMLLLLLGMVFVSNKSICGWGCQLGLWQELLHRVPLPKWKLPFWLSNAVRILSTVALIGGLFVAGLDWIGLIDPFRLFSLALPTWVALFSVGLAVASLFVYRPWCQFLCPFGLLSWLVEQVSVLRPRIDRDVCVGCKACVRACPGQAMASIYEGKTLHADCFACGACLAACPKEGALGWRSAREVPSGPKAERQV